MARRIGAVMDSFAMTIAYAEDSGIRGHIDSVAGVSALQIHSPGDLRARRPRHGRLRARTHVLPPPARHRPSPAAKPGGRSD